MSSPTGRLQTFLDYRAFLGLVRPHPVPCPVPLKGCGPPRAKARVGTVWEQVATGLDTKNGSQVQTEARDGPCLGRGLGR